VAGAKPAHVGVSGGDLLSRDAVARLVRRHGAMGVRADALSDWLASGAPGSAAVVTEIADRLASLLATLRAPATAAAATGARRTYLEVWQGLGPVVVGGGLMKGAVGRGVAARAGAAVGVDVVAAEHPEWLPLIGAARSASGPEERVVVMDGGQTSIKRGVADFRGRCLARLRVLPPLPVDSVASWRLPAVVAREVTAMRDEHARSATEVVCSVASYLEDGRPVPGVASIYERLHPASMRSRFGISLRLVHDGTAAWRAAGTATPSAVIILGTWLGVGIGPHRRPVRPLTADFTVDVEGGPASGPWSPGVVRRRRGI